jgi:glycosyltransferase involved in cell wall biosynthesis
MVLQRMRAWDVATANRVDQYVANSRFVARRIWKIYRRPAIVVHPPVDVDYYQPVSGPRQGYVTASRLVPYKKVDLIIDAFARTPQRHLDVFGDGPDFERLRRKAPPNVRMRGHASRSELRQALQSCRAFVFAALEDFGIVPVEAQACGTPVIALGQGGCAESVVDGKTGILYRVQDVEALLSALDRFETEESRFDPQLVAQHAGQFSASRFRQEFMDVLGTQWEHFQRGEYQYEHDGTAVRRAMHSQDEGAPC